MTVHQLVPIFALALNVLLLGSALAGDRKQHRQQVFAYLATALAVWNLGVFGLRVSPSPASALTWERVVHLGVIPIPALFYHYVLAFLDMPRRRASLVAAYAAASLLAAASPTDWFMEGVVATSWGYAPKSGVLYAPFLIYFWTFLVLGLVRLLIAYQTMVSSFRRNRTRLVIFGVCVSLAGGAVDFLRFIMSWDRLYPLGIPSNAIFAMALGIAIVRYRLWDVSILAKRLVLYLLTSLALVPLVGAGLYVFERVVPDDRSVLHLPVALAIVALVMSTLPFVRKAELWFERLMFARQHGVRDALVGLSKDMAAVLDVQGLGHTLTEGLVRRVPVLQATLYLNEDGSSGDFRRFAQALSVAGESETSEACLDRRLALWLRLTGKPLAVEELAQQAITDQKMTELVRRLEQARVAVLVPLLIEGELAAVLAVGEKVSGEVFDPAEVELLVMLMGQTAIALKNARLYGDLRRQMEELRTTQQQLLQSAKLAAIGELAASVAHELNNPLTVILANASLLIRDMEPDSAPVQKLEKIEAEAIRAGKITGNLLDFSRKREPKHEPLSVNLLVPRAMDLIHAKLRGRPIQIETRLDRCLPPMLGDGDQLTQVLLNLLTNAIDAMPAGGRLVLTTKACAERDTVVISVADTGVGMTDEQMTRIFEPFYTTKGEGGTGLGLSVSLGIVKNHGGIIGVASEPGQGTTITVELPVSSVAEPRRAWFNA